MNYANLVALFARCFADVVAFFCNVCADKPRAESSHLKNDYS